MNILLVTVFEIAACPPVLNQYISCGTQQLYSLVGPLDQQHFKSPNFNTNTHCILVFYIIQIHLMKDLGEAPLTFFFQTNHVFLFLFLN